jgi:hypothetical protein
MSIFLNLQAGVMESLLAFPCCRLRSKAGRTASTMEADLGAFAEAISDLDTSLLLKRLYLPTHLAPWSLTVDRRVSSSISHLLSSCANRGVDVVFEDGEEKLGGSFLPLSTIEYAKKLKAEQETADGA